MILNHYKIGLLIDLVKAFSRYIKPTDKVQVKSFEIGRSGAIEANFIISREGVDHKMYTESIIAGGDIQKEHYRYISHTDLPSSENKDAFAKLQEIRNNLTKAERITSDMEYYKNIHKRDSDKFKALKSKTYDQVMNESYLGSDRNWSNVSDTVKENFKDKDDYDKYIKDYRDSKWQSHLDKTKDSLLEKNK